MKAKPREAKKGARGPLTVGRAALRAYMDANGMTWAQLSEKTGIPVETLAQNQKLNFSNRRVRSHIESALGCNIFSTPEAFRLRQARQQLLGIDPDLAGHGQLIAMARTFGLNQVRGESRASLLERVCAHLAVNRSARPAFSLATITQP